MNGYQGLDAQRLARVLLLEEAMANAGDGDAVIAILTRELAGVVPGAGVVAVNLRVTGDAVAEDPFEPSPLAWREAAGTGAPLCRLEARTNSFAFGSLEIPVADQATVIPYTPFLCHLVGVAARQLEAFLIRDLFQQSLARLQEELAAHAATRDALAQVVGRWERLQSLARMGVWELELATGRVTATRGFLHMIGRPISSGTLTRDALLGFLPVEERERFGALIDLAVHGHAPLQARHLLLGADGGARPVECQGEVERDERGVPRRLVCLVRELSAQGKSRDEAAGQASPQGRRILLAEDAQEIAFMITSFLKGTAVTVEVVGDGAAAVARFKAVAYDLVLMDVQMPDLDGLQATREIRGWERLHNRPPTPIIALTGYATAGDALRCAEAGCDESIAKPVRKAVLLAAVERHLRR